MPPPPKAIDAEGKPAEVRKPKADAPPKSDDDDDDDRARRKAVARPGTPVAPKVAVPKKTEPRRRTGKLTITAALSDEDREERGRSLSAVRRAREKERMKQLAMAKSQEKIVREVIIPETISVQDRNNFV